MSERVRPCTFEQTKRRPRAKDLLPKVNAKRKAVASHEIRHAAVIKKLGYKTEGATVVSSSDYEGATFTAGNLAKHDMQIAAMASAGHGGTGSDEHTAHALSAVGGISVDSAKGIAQGILGSYTDEILDTAAVYLAYDGTATDSQISQYFIWAAEDIREGDDASEHVEASPTPVEQPEDGPLAGNTNKDPSVSNYNRIPVLYPLFNADSHLEKAA